LIEIETPKNIAVIAQETCGVSAVVLQHENGFEPAIRHGMDGSSWISGIPWRMDIQEAMQCAQDTAKLAVRTVAGQERGCQSGKTRTNR